MDLIPNVFNAYDFVCFDAQMMHIFGRLVDDQSAASVLAFIEDVKTNPENYSPEILDLLLVQIEALLRLHEATLRRRTFHLEVGRRQVTHNGELKGLASVLRTISLSDVPHLSDEIAEVLDWLLENRVYWSATIPARTSEDFKAFMYCVRHMVTGERGYDKLETRVSQNRSLFYSGDKEKPRYTTISHIISDVHLLEMIQHGIRFTRECKAQKITDIDKKSLLTSGG